MDRGTTDKVKGRAKQAAGTLLGDKHLENEGRLDRAAGKAKEIAGNLKDKADRLIEKGRRKLQDDDEE